MLSIISLSVPRADFVARAGPHVYYYYLCGFWGNQTPVFMLARKALYRLRHPQTVNVLILLEDQNVLSPNTSLQHMAYFNLKNNGEMAQAKVPRPSSLLS